MAVKKEPRAHNRYTGKRAQNVAWVRDYLQQRLEDKAKRGHVLGREMLIACKWLLIIEGVPVDRTVAKMNRQLRARQGQASRHQVAAVIENAVVADPERTASA